MKRLMLAPVVVLMLVSASCGDAPSPAPPVASTPAFDESDCETLEEGVLSFYEDSLQTDAAGTDVMRGAAVRLPDESRRHGFNYAVALLIDTAAGPSVAHVAMGAADDWPLLVMDPVARATFTVGVAVTDDSAVGKWRDQVLYSEPFTVAESCVKG